MRIMQMTSGGGINGAVVHCLELTRELADRGHEVTLVHRAGAWIADQGFPDNVRFEVSEMSPWPPMSEVRRMAALASALKIDIVHTHQSRANTFGVLMRFFGGPPTVATAHSRNVQLHWRLNAHVIAATDATREFHRRVNLCLAGRIDVVRYFVDAPKLTGYPPQTRGDVRREFNVPENAPLLVTIGQVSRRKGLIYLVEALPELLRDVPDLRALVVGEDSDEYAAEVKGVAARLGVDGSLIWAGSRNDAPRILHACDLMVLPSLEEQMPVSVLEAMTIGVPVITTDVGGIAECVRHEVEGWVVPPRSAEALAAGVRRLLEDAELRYRLIAAARKRIETDFSPDRQVRKVEEIFERVISRRAFHSLPKIR